MTSRGISDFSTFAKVHATSLTKPPLANVISRPSLIEGQYVLEVCWVPVEHLQETLEHGDGARHLQFAGSEQFSVEVNIVCKEGFR